MNMIQKLIVVIVALVIVLLLSLKGYVNYLLTDWVFWGFFFIAACFVSVHSMITPTPAVEEEPLRTRPDVRGVYPRPDQNLTRREIFELGTKYAKRLRFAGLVGLILTLVVTIYTFLPFQSLPVFDKSSKS